MVDNDREATRLARCAGALNMAPRRAVQKHFRNTLDAPEGCETLRLKICNLLHRRRPLARICIEDKKSSNLVLVVMSFLVLVERASGLRNADFMGKSDPYVNLVCGSSKYQTGIIDNNLNPVWDEMFLIHTQPGAEKLDFVLFDSDAGTIVDGSDDFLGQCSLDLRQVANNTNW